MEHRYGVRRPLELRVRIRRRGWSGSYVGLLRNLSSSGAYVQVPAGAFPRLVPVVLEIRWPGAELVVGQRAMVVRTAADGIGLIFDEAGSRLAMAMVGSCRHGEVTPAATGATVAAGSIVN
jgi:hypothetical protein